MELTKITKQRVDEKIARVQYVVYKHLTVAIIELKNGFFVVGHYAPLDADNFDIANEDHAEKGRKLAFEEAVRQVFALEAYADRERVFVVEKKRKAKEAWEALVRRMMQDAYPVRYAEPQKPFNANNIRF
jgi:hypothetical protein